MADQGAGPQEGESAPPGHTPGAPSRDMFATMEPSAAASVEVAESWEQLRPLLQHLYVEGPSGLAAEEGGSVWRRSTLCSPTAPMQQAPLAEIASVLEVARKYGCSTLSQHCQELLCSESFKLHPSWGRSTEIAGELRSWRAWRAVVMHGQS